MSIGSDSTPGIDHVAGRHALGCSQVRIIEHEPYCYDCSYAEGSSDDLAKHIFRESSRYSVLSVSLAKKKARADKRMLRISGTGLPVAEVKICPKKP